ncbi:MAG: hypothetical protein LBS74_08835, partial [Oscillospiraceae bacterium]|nr:hypothetical protein [Oscillospiraceae bacterium]
MNAEFTREEFDRKIAENPLNEHLRVAIEPIEQTGSIELVQVGDFFEAYGEDAHILAEVFGFTVLQRDGKDMVGFPSSQLDDNLDVLVNDHNYTVEVNNEPLTPDYTTSPREMYEQSLDDELYIPKIGDRYEIQGRQFVVDSVSEEWGNVSLQDITFQQSAGFPIFRKESLDFIRMYDPIREEHKKDEPPLADNQHTETIGGVEYIVTTPFAKGRKQENGVNFPGEIEVIQDHIPQLGENESTEETITPAWEQKQKPVRVNYFDAFPNVAMADRHNFKITDDNLGHGGAKAKFRANMDAINLLHDLEFDGKLATPEQQEILSRYVGWGGLPQAFDPDKADWADEFLELQTALSTEEYESARATTLNAHYTSPVVIKAIYKAVENMGFTTGNVLDPGCGIGNFQGLLPDSMSGSKFYGIEIDPITGRIAQQLYQKNSIAIQGYEKTALPDSFFDLAIGNVPFGGY